MTTTTSPSSGSRATSSRNQEPGTDAEILEFATSKYGVTFPMFHKIEVNGDGAAPLYHGSSPSSRARATAPTSPGTSRSSSSTATATWWPGSRRPPRRSRSPRPSTATADRDRSSATMTIEFTHNERPTVGIEMELHVVDRATGELVSAANELLDELGIDHPEGRASEGQARTVPEHDRDHHRRLRDTGRSGP